MSLFTRLLTVTIVCTLGGACAQKPDYGPLAISDYRYEGTYDNSTGVGTLDISSDCVTLTRTGFGDLSLAWRAADVSWNEGETLIEFDNGMMRNRQDLWIGELCGVSVTS